MRRPTLREWAETGWYYLRLLTWRLRPRDALHHARATAYIRGQERRFDRHRAELLADFLGRHVAYEDGRVLASGDTAWETLERLKRNYPDRPPGPILIKRVQAVDPVAEL